MATNKVFASYEEILDLHTETNKVTAIGIHTPTGNTPMKMFPGFFTQFKKYKYIGCSVSLIPAATLPADPLQVAYGEGNPDDPYTIDPREMLNPIMFHGCHGEDMGTILNQLTCRDSPVSPSMDAIQNTTSAEYMASTLERLYYKALTDRTWKKAHPQRGFKKSGLRPLLYSLASTRQITPGMVPTGIMDNNLLGWNEAEDVFDVAGGPENWKTTVDSYESSTVNKLNKGAMQFVTPRLTSLGYLDTKNVLTGEGEPISTLEQVDLMRLSENYAELPKIFMGILLMPPSYKVLQHYRMVLSHRFVFKNFRGISFSNDVAVPPTYRNVYGSGDDDLLDYDGDTEMYPFGPVIEGSGGGESTLPTRPVYVRLAGTSSHLLTAYALGYRMPDDIYITWLVQGLGGEPTSSPTLFGPFSVPVGATIVGTAIEKSGSEGVAAYMNIDLLTPTTTSWNAWGTTWKSSSTYGLTIPSEVEFSDSYGINLQYPS